MRRAAHTTRSDAPAPAGDDALFAALASAERRRMLDLLLERPGMHVAALGTHFAMSDVAVLKHVRTLERAGLVISRREGRVRQLYVNVMPIQAMHQRWTDSYGAFWANQVAAIKSRVESRVQQRGIRRA